MKINNSLDVARWEKITCKCDMNDIEKCYPIANCEHCRCQACWDSVPKENFTIKEYNQNTESYDDNIINEISLVRGERLQDVIGWEF